MATEEKHGIKYVKDLDEFNNILKESGNKLVVVDFTASWCGPCKLIGPKFEAMSKLAENSNVVFLKVDVDDAEDVSSQCGIKSMPTFQFYRNGKKVGEFSGADQEKLKATIENLRQ